MPLTYQALKCVKCNTFQAKQTSKTQKFSCALCGEKQTIQRVYAISPSAKDIRLHVQQLNMARGQAYQAQQEVLANIVEQLAEDEDACEQVDVWIQQQDNGQGPQQQQTDEKTASRYAQWHSYVQHHDVTQDSEEDDRHAYDDPRFVTALQTAKQRKGNRNVKTKPCCHSNDENDQQRGARKHKQNDMPVLNNKHFAANINNQPMRRPLPMPAADRPPCMLATSANLPGCNSMTAAQQQKPQITCHNTQQAVTVDPLTHTNRGGNPRSNSVSGSYYQHQAQHSADVADTQPREQTAYPNSCYNQNITVINTNQLSNNNYQTIDNHQLDTCLRGDASKLNPTSHPTWQLSRKQNTTALQLTSSDFQATCTPALAAQQHTTHSVAVGLKGYNKWGTFATAPGESNNSNTQLGHDTEDIGFVTAL